MNDIEEFNIRYIATEHKNICINIETFLDILKDFEKWIQPITKRDVLKQGLYAMVDECHIWVSRDMTPKCIKVSNQEILNVKDDKWSPAILLTDATIDYIERFQHLKAFW